MKWTNGEISNGENLIPNSTCATKASSSLVPHSSDGLNIGLLCIIQTQPNVVQLGPIY